MSSEPSDVRRSEAVASVYITMGDPRGVGPEVALRALATWEGSQRVRLVGVAEVFEEAARELGLDSLFRRLAPDLLDIREARAFAGSPRGGAATGDSPDRGHRPRARVGPAIAGEWAGRAVEAAVREIRPEDGDALVTAPLDKAALRAGGYDYPGHTELLAALAGARTAMMLVAEGLRVSLVTTHVPLRDVPARLTGEAIRQVFLLTRHALVTGFGIAAPRIAVAALNPHAGEGGLLGDEEERVVLPALRALRAEGHDVEGPLSGDTVFVRAVAGEFDGVLALFHDQGMIPVKLHGFGRGVNVTLGLPFVRTSPDHGTALDIAGTGRARPDSFAAALALAVDLAARPAFTRAPVYKESAAV